MATKGKAPDFPMGKEEAGEEDKGGKERETPSGLESAMEEFIGCVKTNDAKGAAEAFHSAFLISENSPHEEADEEDEGEEAEQ